MKKNLLLAAIIPAALWLTGCDTTGLSVREQHNGYSTLINSRYRKAPGGPTNQPVVRPIQLAVAEIGEVSPEASFVTELGADPSLVRTVIPLPMPGEITRNYGYGQGGNLANSPDKLATQVESARNLARDSGAQYLLLVGGSVDSYNTENALGVLDLTIVCGFLTPATEVHMDGKAAGALIDVETGRIVLMVSSQVGESAHTPTFFASQKHDEMSAEMRNQVLKVLAGNFQEKLKQQSTEPAAR